MHLTGSLFVGVRGVVDLRHSQPVLFCVEERPDKWLKDGGASIATYATHWINFFMYRFMFANQNLIKAPEYHGFN